MYIPETSLSSEGHSSAGYLTECLRIYARNLPCRSSAFHLESRLQLNLRSKEPLFLSRIIELNRMRKDDPGQHKANLVYQDFVWVLNVPRHFYISRKSVTSTGKNGWKNISLNQRWSLIKRCNAVWLVSLLISITLTYHFQS